VSETPEQAARREIDADLGAAGWYVQDRDDLDLTVGRGIAVREFPMKYGFGHADYLLYLDGKAAGAIEAKARGYAQRRRATDREIRCGLAEASAQPAELMAGGAGGVGPGLGRTGVTRLGARSRPAGRPRCG
jgi:hypothetical protein